MKNMKNIFLFILTITLFSCSKNLAYENEFTKSEKTFHQFKRQNNNSYKFVLYNSSWTNTGFETTIYVQNGKVVRKDFLATQGEWKNDKWNYTVLEEYTETEPNINTHVSGPRAITLDEIYAIAKNDLLTVDKKSNTIYFEAKNNGMISSVGYFPIGCQDDCFRGYSISSIEPLK